MAFTLHITSTAADVAKLCALYWEIDEAREAFVHPVARLAAEHGLSMFALQNLVHAHSSAASLFLTCPGCATPYAFKNRQDYSRWKYVREPRIGPQCEQCQARAAELQRRQTLQRRQDQADVDERHRHRLRAIFDPREVPPVLLTELPLVDAIALLAAIRVGGDEELESIRPPQRFSQMASPGGRDDAQWMSSLYRAGALLPSAESPASAFHWVGEELASFDLPAVSWVWPAADGSSLADALETLEVCLGDRRHWAPHWAAEERALGRWIAVGECLEYLVISLEDHKLPFEPGAKTTAVLNLLLDHFSIGQVYNMIWRAARDSAAFSMRASVPRSQAANSSIGRMQRYGETALANGWELKAFRPDRRCPQSMSSQIFFHKVRKLGDAYFTTRLEDAFDDATRSTCISLPAESTGATVIDHPP